MADINIVKSPVYTAPFKAEKPTITFAALMERIIEILKRLFKGADKPTQETITQRAIEIFTAKPQAGTVWNQEFVRRKEAVVALLKNYNKQNPKDEISESIIKYVQQLPIYTHAEVIQTPLYMIDRYTHWRNLERARLRT